MAKETHSTKSVRLHFAASLQGEFSVPSLSSPSRCPRFSFQESKGHESKELPNEEGTKSEDENDEKVQEAGRAGQKKRL